MIEKHRKKIDLIDAKIIKLISQRYKLTEKIGKYKKNKGIKTIDTKREQEIISNVKKIAEFLELPKTKLVSIFKKIFEISYHSQK